jgi:hypothetical protein
MAIVIEEWRRRRAAKRVKPGDGRALQRFRWWQMLRRSLLFIELPSPSAERPTTYTVDVHLWGDKDGEIRAHLYRDGRHHAESKVPARFPVEGGNIEVAVSGFGVKRAHFVADDGSERQLVPDPHSAEGRRARFDRRHPAASRWVGVVSLLMLLVGAGLNLLQLIEPLSEIPPIADTLGTFESPIRLPVWANVSLGLAAVIGSTERALRLRYSWLDSFAS